MKLAKKDGGLYYLKPLEREYAFSRVRDEGVGLVQSAKPAFVRKVLLRRGADFFRAGRVTHEGQDQRELSTELDEFDLRFSAGDYEDAARLLVGIDEPFLLLRGSFRTVVQLHEKL